MVTMVNMEKRVGHNGHHGHWGASIAGPARMWPAVGLGRVSKVTVHPGLGLVAGGAA
jgi:hypothetical protein